MGSRSLTEEEVLTNYSPHNGPVLISPSTTKKDGLGNEMESRGRLPSYQEIYTTDSAPVAAAKQPKTTGIKRCHMGCASCFQNYSSNIARVILGILFVAYTVYLAFAIRHHLEYSKALVVITGLTVFFICYAYIRNHFGHIIYQRFLRHIEEGWIKHWHCMRWFILPAIVLAIMLYLVLDVVKDARQLQSLSGMVVFVALEYIFSKHPNRVNWRPVLWGFTLQFIMAIIVLRWKDGYIGIQWLSDQITMFIGYGLDGAAAVFGDPFLIFHPFVFMGMPLLIYIGAVMSILYYLGFTQVLAQKVGWAMQITMGTTAIESLGVAANIFLNGMDVMLMLRNYLDKLTASEFHCFLVGNHATVAGFAFALFVLFGAPPQHLLSAAVMSAPATVAIAKLNYPETEESQTKTQEDIQLEKGEETNVIEAGANGAAVAGQTVAAVLVNFIGFLSMLAFINSTLSWLGGRVGYPQLSFEVICSYVFWPIALIIGIEVKYCREVAKLIGIKVFTSEVLAYQELGVSVANELKDSPRSIAITTYALCGFSGLSTLAIAVGVWYAVCPDKVHQMTSQMWRAIINANVSCFFTACVAGLMYNPDLLQDGFESEPSAIGNLISGILGIIPSYKDLINLL